jgi:phosphatidate cytidylyltransferase
MTNLMQRMLSALGIIAIVAFSLFVREEVFIFLITLLLFFSSIEWVKMLNLTVWHNICYAIFNVTLLLFGIFVDHFWLVSIGVLWWGIGIILLFQYVSNSAAGVKWSAKAHLIVGAMLLVPSCSSIIVLRKFGSDILLILLLLVWAVDIGGYFVGKKYGANKLMPLISPAKTIEGSLGGVALAIILTLAAYYIIPIDSFGLLEIILITVFIAVFAILGDLFESMVKRRFGIKDSGNVIPGHGGLLDRIDSLTAAAPPFALLLLYMPF